MACNVDPVSQKKMTKSTFFFLIKIKSEKKINGFYGILVFFLPDYLLILHYFYPIKYTMFFFLSQYSIIFDTIYFVHRRQKMNHSFEVVFIFMAVNVCTSYFLFFSLQCCMTYSLIKNV